MVLNENNAVIDVHSKGQEGGHSFVTQIGPLERQDIKTGTIKEGALVTAELNEAGSVIDLHRAKQ